MTVMLVGSGDTTWVLVQNWLTNINVNQVFVVSIQLRTWWTTMRIKVDGFNVFASWSVECQVSKDKCRHTSPNPWSSSALWQFLENVWEEGQVLPCGSNTSTLVCSHPHEPVGWLLDRSHFSQLLAKLFTGKGLACFCFVGFLQTFLKFAVLAVYCFLNKR